MNYKKMKGTVIGVAFIALSIFLMAMYPDDDIARRAAFSGSLMGIFLLFMRVNYTIPEQVTGSVVESTTSSIHDILTGLNIKGNGIFLPPKGDTRADRVFVPLQSGKGAPDLRKVYDKGAIVTDNVSKNYGVLISSPGGRLIELMQRESETDFNGIGAELMCETIKVMEGLELVDSIEADYEDNEIKVSFTHSNFEGNCAHIREGFQYVCERTCCPICGVILSSFARSEGRALQIKEVKRKNKVYIKARFLDI